jgi:hypothetical protein
MVTVTLGFITTPPFELGSGVEKLELLGLFRFSANEPTRNSLNLQKAPRNYITLPVGVNYFYWLKLASYIPFLWKTKPLEADYRETVRGYLFATRSTERVA